MDLFQIVFLDVILLYFPILIYQLYLSTNKNMDDKAKGIYLNLAIITSFFLVYKFGIDKTKLVSILVLNSITAFAYLMDYYVLANVIGFLIILCYRNYFNYIDFLSLTYLISLLIYAFKRKFNLSNSLFTKIFIFISSIIYLIWVYKFNYSNFDMYKTVLIIISYVFITIIFCIMYIQGENILKGHLTFKELQKEKQIRLSLFKITHEIKNPIAVCKGYLDMLNVKDSKQVEKFIPIIKSEIERLLSLLQDFLLINKNSLDLDIMDFNMLIEETIEKMDPLLKENNINVKLSLVDDEIYINGDYNRLSQVIMNLIKNSIEAIPKGKIGVIEIITKVKKNKCILIIDDNGIGMDKQTLERIRTPFFTTKARGSGLGVSLIYEIIEAHHGSLKYESEINTGTKTEIKIPIYNS